MLWTVVGCDKQLGDDKKNKVYKKGIEYKISQTPKKNQKIKKTSDTSQHSNKNNRDNIKS